MSEKTASLMASLTGDGAPATNNNGDNPSNVGEAGDDLFGEIPVDDPTSPTLAAAGSQAASVSAGDSTMSKSNGNTNDGNFPYPQPPRQMPMANAPNITYAAPATNPASADVVDMTQSQPAPAIAASIAAPAPASKSLLMNSGLLGMASGGGNDETTDNTRGGGGGGGLFDDIDEEEETKAKAAAEEERKKQEAAVEAEKQRQQQEAAAAAAALAQQQQQQKQQQQKQQHMQQPTQQQYSMEARMQGMHLYDNAMQHSQQMQQNSQMIHQQQPGQMTDPSNQMQQQNQGQMMPDQQQQSGMQHPRMQQQQQQQQQPPSQISAPGVMYRDHSGLDGGINNPAGFADHSAAMQQPGIMGQSTMNNPASPSRFYHPGQQPVPTAGMHNSTMSPSQQPASSLYGGGGGGSSVMPQQRYLAMAITKPPDVPTWYGKVTINDPMLLQAPSKLFNMVSAPPHWSYQVTTEIRGQPPSVWMVRRRFRHVVALEDRLRHECPGAILPPRPDKHVSRAIEEASTNQSAEFAWQRAAEIGTYLNALVNHPEVYSSQSLKMFLGLQDDMGTAWPEVSANAFTRLSAMGTSAAAKMQESSASGIFGTAAPATTTPGQSGGVMSNVMGSVASSVGAGDLVEPVTEDSAELLALASSESVRMGAVLQAVPKLEGAVSLLREQGEVAGAVGMELNRLAKEVLTQGDRELSMPLEVLSNGLLRHGRRTKRLGQEIGQATLAAYQLHYKLCNYEKLAWNDRRSALKKRSKGRMNADKRAQQMMGYQQQQMMGYGGGYGQQNMGMNVGNPMMNQAIMSDNMAINAVQDCEMVGERLKREINRISYNRRMDWAKSVKVIASYMKEAATERVAIWESTRDTFLQTFPDYNNESAQWTNVPQQQAQPQQQQQANLNSSYMAQPGMMSQSYQQPSSQQHSNQQYSEQPQYKSMMGNAMPTPAAGVFQQS